MKKLMAFMAAASLLLVSCEKKVDVIDDSSALSFLPSSSVADNTSQGGESSVSDTPGMEDFQAARDVLDKFYDAMLIHLDAAKLLEYSNVDMMYLRTNSEPMSYDELLANMEKNLGGAAEKLGVEASSYEILDAVVVDPVIITTANNFISNTAHYKFIKSSFTRTSDYNQINIFFFSNFKNSFSRISFFNN